MLPELTAAERFALEATKLESFPANLQEIRRTLDYLLSEFGRYGLFDEFTTHNYEHVHEMLQCLDWLIPEGSKALLTKGDWFLLTLACYFHDLGLVVTRDEYEARGQSKFEDFCENNLFSGPDAADYRAKMNELEPERREKILYQEFVRFNHAARVRGWIMGRPETALGKASAVADELNRLLKPLPASVRNDLASVCESHNLSDLDDSRKYPLFRPYGRSADETVNLLYVAVLLRSADLIQITHQRAPTVLYKLINPKDPTSQIEWLKQNAVNHIRPKPKEDRSGEISAAVQSDTIEVYAAFTKAEGFFGLSSYLRYAEEELQKSHSLIEKAKRKSEKKLSFPWRYIDDGHISTEGFEPKQYGFELDQSRILDLLIGHTLYNDSTVVIRELTQNAIDAVRLQAAEDSQSSEQTGKIEIRWDSKNAELEIVDNGTGMTQDIIEQHLLKVGSSRYQDPKFIETHPEFSPISRFGIGVLSAFMVADVVEIVTCSPAEEFARQISLRSVHGKYLVRLLDKAKDAEVGRLAPHGTSVKLKLRASAKRVDVLRTVRRWILFPRCSVVVEIDEAPPVKVGFSSPKGALEHYLLTMPLSDESMRKRFRVEEKTIDGLTVAYSIYKSSFFNDWTLVRYPQERLSIEGVPVAATCVEGITVEIGSPGFREGGLLAIANATGKDAPKTNVARSSLEDTEGRLALIRQAYEVYVSQLDAECQRLAKEENYPLSRVVTYVPYMATELSWSEQRDRHRVGETVPINRELLKGAFSKLPLFLLESESRRTAASLDNLRKLGRFWTAESPLIFSLETLIREFPVDVTANAILNFSKGSVPQLPDGAIVSNLNSSLAKASIEGVFEICRVRAVEAGHRLELEWKITDAPNWVSQTTLERRLREINPREWQLLEQAFEQRYDRFHGYMALVGGDILIPKKGIHSEGLSDFSAFRALDDTYLLPNDKFAQFVLSGFDSKKVDDLARCYIYLQIVRRLLAAEPTTSAGVQELFDRSVKLLVPTGFDRYLSDVDEARKLICDSAWRSYNPFAWSRTSFRNE